MAAAHVHSRELCGDLLGKRVVAHRIADVICGSEQLLRPVVPAAGHRKAAEHEAAPRCRRLAFDLVDERQHVIDSAAEEHVLRGEKGALVALRTVHGQAARRQHRVGRRIPCAATRELDAEDDQVGGELRIAPRAAATRWRSADASSGTSVAARS